MGISFPVGKTKIVETAILALWFSCFPGNMEESIAVAYLFKFQHKAAPATEKIRTAVDRDI